MSDVYRQGDLFDPGVDRASVHRNARDTERDAAELIAPKAGTLRRLAYDALLAAPDGLTDLELAARTSKWLYSIAPRRVELVRAGLVIDSGIRRPGPTGARAIVWKAIAA